MIPFILDNRNNTSIVSRPGIDWLDKNKGFNNAADPCEQYKDTPELYRRCRMSNINNVHTSTSGDSDGGKKSSGWLDKLLGFGDKLLDVIGSKKEGSYATDDQGNYYPVKDEGGNWVTPVLIIGGIAAVGFIIYKITKNKQ